MSSSSPPNPPSTTTATTNTTSPRLFSSNPSPQPPPQRSLNPPLLQHHHHPNAYNSTPIFPPPSLRQLPQQTLFTNPTRTHPQTIKTQQDSHHQGVLYPVASSGRGFLPKPVAGDQNSGGFPPRPIAPYSYPGRPYGFPHSDPQHLVRPMTHLQHTLFSSSTGGTVVKGVPVSTNPKVAPSPSPVSDCNGFKDLRDRSRDDTLITVRDRKVKISEGTTLYAQCRSWLKNGVSDENQPQYVDCAKSLPKPLPMSMVDAEKKEDDEEEEEENVEDVEHLSPKELLQGHMKRAKKVRARLREERLQRIARYKGRLALLLPPVVEQQFKNDSAFGN